MMNAQEIIAYIAAAEKKTPVKVYVNELADIDYGSATVFGEGRSKVVFGDWRELGPILAENAGAIADIVVENDRRNSAIPLLDLKGVNARIEPGAIIREQVSIGDNAVVMMGAILNIGAVVGEGTMIDMGAVLGGRPPWAGTATSAPGPSWPGSSSPPAPPPWSSRTACWWEPTPWSSRASGWAGGPWWLPGPW